MNAAAARASHRRMITEVGETIKIRRYSGTGNARTSTDYEVLARVMGYQPHELVGGIVQGDRKLIVLADDLEASELTLPVLKTDKAVVRGKELAIQGVDDSTRRIGGTLIAYEITARG